MALKRVHFPPQVRSCADDRPTQNDLLFLVYPADLIGLFKDGFYRTPTRDDVRTTTKNPIPTGFRTRPCYNDFYRAVQRKLSTPFLLPLTGCDCLYSEPMSIEYIIDKVTNNGAWFLAALCNHPAGQGARSRTPLDVECTTAAASAVHFSPALRTMLPPCLGDDKAETIETSVAQLLSAN